MTVTNALYVVMPIVMVAAMGVWLGLVFRADSQQAERASRRPDVTAAGTDELGAVTPTLAPDQKAAA